MTSFTKRVYALADILGAIAALLLIGLVLLMSYNVIMRYAFGASSLGLEELSWHFYACIFLLGIPYAMRHAAHVRVDVLYDKFPEQRKTLVDIVGTLIFLLPFSLVVVYTGFEFTAAAYNLGVQPGSLAEFFSQLVTDGIGEKSQDPGGLLNRWIIKGIIPFSFLMLFLTGLAVLLEKMQAFRGQSK